MKVPRLWLHDYCSPELSTAQLVERLDLTGTKVERTYRHGGGGDADHPHADVLELEVTPNRPDCLGVYGVAREVHAATGVPLAPAPWLDDPGSSGSVEGAAVVVDCPELCPRFTARVFDDVKIGPSPGWLKARLMAAGQRPISNVVDITNFAMLSTGQPLHAFDLDRVPGGRLTVRRALAGERMTTLDGVERGFDEEMVLVCDDEGPSGVAGVMGGARSEVSDQTTRVLLEVATWDGPNIHRTTQRLGLRSEASARFEKQLAPEQALHAQALATKLLIELCGASVRPGTVDVGGDGPPPAVIRLRDEHVERVLGAPLPRSRCRQILSALDFAASDADDGLDVAVPPLRRNDVTREADLIEEVARLDGFEKLPSTLPARRGASGRLTTVQALRRRAEDALAARGLSEVAGGAMTAPEVADRLRLGADDPRRAHVELANPLSGDQSVLRTLLLGSLLDAARHNVAHGAGDLWLFEVGTVFRAVAGEPLPDERRHVTALLRGAARPATWRDPEPPAADVYAIKGVLAGLLDTLRVAFETPAAAEPFLHPGRAARVIAAGDDVGWVGELHPRVAQEWDIGAGAAFEVDLDAVCAAATTVPRYRDLISFPDVRQDIAVVVDAAIPAAEVLAVVRRAGGPELEHAEVFDVYRGEQVGEGRVSLALRLRFRAPDRTLTDEDAAAAREAIAAALATELGATLRA